ncbi:unnamed protein product [Polarella glacialis]|uniref:SMB domain-containing protein n=1 Tax=Polarella glacialis TaxID=89957 RepID=A0A813FX85_POLGL|nr:unnamed protein product [Polarella glacialis]
MVLAVILLLLVSVSVVSAAEGFPDSALADDDLLGVRQLRARIAKDILSSEGALDLKEPTCRSRVCGNYVHGERCQCDAECVRHHNCCNDYKAKCGLDKQEPKKTSSLPSARNASKMQEDTVVPQEVQGAAGGDNPNSTSSGDDNKSSSGDDKNSSQGSLPSGSMIADILDTSRASLHKASGAPLYSFYMYRAVSGEAFPPMNVNAGTLAGVLWYLHHEVVIQAPRKFGIKKIIRFKVHMRATEPLLRIGMHFGVRTAFDSGIDTGPFVSGRKYGDGATAPEPDFAMGAFHKTIPPYKGAFEWEKYGNFVGCNKLGSFPFPMYEVFYPEAVWYSLPGPGAACKGPPTGAEDCTWSYESDGEEISLDELVGDVGGAREYDPDSDRGNDFSWWNGLNNAPANAERVRQAQAPFTKKYPKSRTDADMPAPPCDFDFLKFYKEFYLNAAQSGDCQNAQQSPGSSCDQSVKWGMGPEGVVAHPEWFLGLTPQSSYSDFQQVLFMQGKGGCKRPCAV